MIIIHRGYGLLVPVIAAAAGIAVVLPCLFADIDFLMKACGGMGFVAAGTALWFAGKFFEKRAEKNAQKLTDPKSGEQVSITAKHDLYFIPIKYWGIIFYALSPVAWFIAFKR